MQQAETLVFLFALVAALVLIARRIAVPYPVLLVLAGLAISFIPRLPQMRLQPDVVFYFFLPPLIYPAALLTSWRDFRRDLQPILSLAIGLVLFFVGAIAVVIRARWYSHLRWPVTYLLLAVASLALRLTVS